ncbi:MAG: TonB family protein [Candidatus Tectimicrobiota bacterium]
MYTSRLQFAFSLSVLLHLVLLVALRLLPLPTLSASPEPPAAPVAVQLLDLPQSAPPLATPAPVRPQALPEVPERGRPSTPPPPAPREPEVRAPQPAVAPPPSKGGIVVDLPKPVREERPDEARIISRYDSKAQDLGPGEGGAHKPSGAHARTAPPEIALPERYSKGQTTPPSAPLMPTTPAVPTPASPSVTTPAPRPPASPAAGSEILPRQPATPVAPSEMLTPPSPPIPIPQAKPEPPVRLVTPVVPRLQSEEKRPLLETRPAPSTQARTTAPQVPESPRPSREDRRRPAAPPAAEAPQARSTPLPPPPPPVASEGQRRAETPPAIPSVPAAPGRPMTPEELRRYRLTAQQELAMMQRDPEARPGTGSASGQKRQSLDEHFASLEKHQPLLSFDGPGVYGHGPERSGEGRGDGEGGKYRSIASFGFKHVSYLLGMQRKIELVFTVPAIAPDRGAMGVPIVGFTVRRNGELAETVLLRSSGYPAVDQALIRAVRRAAPYRPFPDDMSEQEISIRIYATFS